LSEEIHQTSPNAKIQWYQTWGRPYGDGDRCDEIPQVCTFDGTYAIFPNLVDIFTNVTIFWLKKSLLSIVGSILIPWIGVTANFLKC
jgi:hypothetical protein